MLARIWSAALIGIDAVKVGVEVDISGGLPGMVVVGLPDTAVQESRERVKAALKNAGFPFPMRKIVVNLTPADLRKEGPVFDLPMSVGILAASEQISLIGIDELLFLGELSFVRAIIFGHRDQAFLGGFFFSLYRSLAFLNASAVVLDDFFAMREYSE